MMQATCIVSVIKLEFKIKKVDKLKFFLFLIDSCTFKTLNDVKLTKNV